MKRLVIAGTIVLCAVLNAHAGQMVYKWYDTIRPNGHKRPDGIGYANSPNAMRNMASRPTGCHRSSKPAWKASAIGWCRHGCTTSP